MKADDPYSRVDYRRLVAWPQRIEREWPFLERALGRSGRVLDLGSGTGEHSRFLASKGFDVVGIAQRPPRNRRRLCRRAEPSMRRVGCVA